MIHNSLPLDFIGMLLTVFAIGMLSVPLWVYLFRGVPLRGTMIRGMWIIVASQHERFALVEIPNQEYMLVGLRKDGGTWTGSRNGYDVTITDDNPKWTRSGLKPFCVTWAKCEETVTDIEDAGYHKHAETDVDGLPEPNWGLLPRTRTARGGLTLQEFTPYLNDHGKPGIGNYVVHMPKVMENLWEMSGAKVVEQTSDKVIAKAGGDSMSLWIQGALIFAGGLTGLGMYVFL